MISLQRQEFDEQAFETPFYRIAEPADAAIERDIQALRERGEPFIVDAKVAADDLAASRRLQEMGFRKVCMQITLVKPSDKRTQPDPAAAVVDHVDWPRDIIERHAGNFVFDRFALDAELPRAGHDRLYAMWISNSLAGGRNKVLHIDHNFLTFREDGPGLKIDLLSVLDHSRGIGGRLLNSLAALAAGMAKDHITTVTECENKAAVGLYLKSGYTLSEFTSVFHLVEGGR